jgi:ATP-dependent Clp protease ATP-binding subunit ClpB
VLDDGRLTDGQGRTVDFRNTVVVMTSNLGSEVIQTMAGEAQYDEMKQAVMNLVGQHFRPEFINRIDESVVFHPLNRQQIRAIAAIQLQQLNQRLNNHEMELVLSDAALDKIAEIGFNPIYGARPLKRAIQQIIANPLSQRLLAGDFISGDTIHGELDPDNDQIIFN